MAQNIMAKPAHYNGVRALDFSKGLSTIGWMTSAFSAGAGLLIVFVVPTRSSYVSALLLVTFTLFFVLGLAGYMIGKLLARRHTAA